MKIALWIGVAVLAVLWTAGAALTAALTGWAAGLIASGAATDIGQAAAQWQVPAWLALWVDPALLRSAQETMLWTLQTFQQTLPWFGGALGLLVPLVWVLWGIGLALLLAIGAGLHVLAGRAGRKLGGPGPTL